MTSSTGLSARNGRRARPSFFVVTAIDKGMTPATVIVDEAIHYKQGDGSDWSPQNYNKKYLGPSH